MKVSEVNSINTFFELTASEQSKYDDFRAAHDEIKRKNDEFPGSYRAGSSERNNEEKEVSKMFLDLINPYFKNMGIRNIWSSTYYGNPRDTSVESSKILLFKDGKPFNSFVDFQFQFVTQDEKLSCKSYLNYNHSEGCYNVYELKHNIVYDLLEKITKGKNQDGISLPKLHSHAFASTDFALPLMHLIKYSLERMGSKSMKELNILNEEYFRQVNDGKYRDTTLQQKIFKEAYEEKLEETIMNCKLVTELRN